MKKDDLETGMVVELNNGVRYMVIRGDKNILIRGVGWASLDSFSSDMKYGDCSIEEIYNPPISGIDDLFRSCMDDEYRIWKRKRTDWTKVDVDAKIFVQIGLVDYPMHFSHYGDNRVYYFPHGTDSWTCSSVPDSCPEDKAKLITVERK